MAAVHTQCAELEGFDQIADAAAAWDIDFRLLGTGDGSGVIEAIATGRAIVQRNRFGWNLHQRGVAPGGFRTFGVAADDDQHFPWNGYGFAGDNILSFPADGAFESVSGVGFHVYSLSFDEELVQHTAEVLGLHFSGDSLPAAGTSEASAEPMRGIRDTIRRILETSRQNETPGSDEQHGLARVIEWKLLSQILKALSASRPLKRPRARLRALALKRSMAFIEQTAGQPVTVRRLCEVSGASWRTLDYAFKERYGLGPKAYLRTRRLNAVHAELRDTSPEDGTVARAAGRWGFWHMGQFAADYRKLFGELPSETLRGRNGEA